MLKRSPRAFLLQCRASRTRTTPGQGALFILPSLPRRPYTSTPQARQHAETFPSQSQDPSILSTLQPRTSTPPPTPQTLTEKIVQRYSLGLDPDARVKSGDYIVLSPHRCMTHDNSWPTALKFKAIGASKIHDPRQIVMTLDHDVQNKSEKNLGKYARIEEFAKQQGVDFYPAGRGIGHQIMVEEGYAFPATITVASDSHSNMYGGVGSLGMPIVRTDAAAIWATGRTWWRVPPIAKVQFTGKLPKGVTGKDVIVALSGLFNQDEVLNHAIEFTGAEETMKSLDIDARLTIANMTTEWGALSGLFPIDSTLKTWLHDQAAHTSSETAQRFSPQRIDALYANPITADPGAKYAKYLYLNLSTLSPYVSGPNSVKVATPLDELSAQSIKIDKAYLVSCTNSRASDLAAAAKVFKDAVQATGGPVKITAGVSFYIAAASLPEQKSAEAAGDWQALLDAGAIPLPAGCGPCIGLGTGLLEDGEVGISASNRNFKGRMGSQKAKAYLASPEVVAASALHGTISGPGSYSRPEGWKGVELGHGEVVERGPQISTAASAIESFINQLDSAIDSAESQGLASTPQPTSTASATAGTIKPTVDILPGFPERIQGEILFLDADNISTDGIYPGKYTYQDDVPQETMAQVCMENYDPNFSSVARAGDIMATGSNFGCGSSREQAVTSILARGLPLVVSGSVGNTFSRNAINNALPLLEVPRLVHRLRERFSSNSNEDSVKARSQQQQQQQRQQQQQQQQEVKEPSHNRESLDSPPPAPQAVPPNEKMLTRRTGWTFTWDVRLSRVTVKEGEEEGEEWSQDVAALPRNVQEIIARGGLEGWVRAEIGKS